MLYSLGASGEARPTTIQKQAENVEKAALKCGVFDQPW